MSAWRSHELQIGSDRDPRDGSERKRHGRLPPLEECDQTVQKALDGRQLRELMREHVCPLRAKLLRPSRLRRQRSARGKRHPLRLALSREEKPPSSEIEGLGEVVEDVDDVVQVPGTGPLQ